VVGFFYFRMRMKWIGDNPMKALRPPKVKQDPTLPFTREEIEAIVATCDRYPIKGIYREGNRKRLRAMILLLRYFVVLLLQSGFPCLKLEASRWRH
jgi:integrase